MLIAVNTRLLQKGRLEGIGWFTYETLKRISTGHPEHRFLFIFDRPYDPSFVFAPNVEAIVVSPPTRHPLLWYLWFEWRIPAVLRKYKPDLFLSTDGWLPLKANCKTVDVIHDLNMMHYPQYIKWLVRKYYFHFFPRFARKATRLATVSEYSKQDLIRLIGRKAEDIDVVYNGCNAGFRPLSSEDQKEVRQRYTNGSGYFLFVGLVHPRKNMVNLFKAFDLFKKETGSSINLMVVGEKKWWTDDIRFAYESMTYRDAVILTGRLSDEALHAVVGAAMALTYVPVFEGFGIPILEAFNAGVPVITSNVTSMPEVAADAAILVDPFDPTAISKAMQLVTEDRSLAKRMVQRGHERAMDFSWDRSAGLLWNCIEKTMRS